jgi:hypothetical protein
MLASVQPEEAFPDNPDALFSYDAHFTRDDRVLVQQDGGALYEFDLATLRPIRTVLAGAEGLVFGSNHFYCGGSFRLARDRLLTTDSQFQPKGTDKSMTLRLWDASMLFGSNSSFDPSRPYTRQLLAMDSAT